jgi:ketosteroid isomerase-like protein
MLDSKSKSSPLISRRAALAGIAAAPLSPQIPGNLASAESAVTERIQVAADKNAAFMRGDMSRWVTLANIAPEFTLMQPFGGPASHGFDSSPERLAQLARYFRNGDTSLEVTQAIEADGMIVIVMIERQQAEVGGLPRQDWSLRVTEVYRKDGETWRLAHRHADPLVQKISLDQAAALARGDK